MTFDGSKGLDGPVSFEDDTCVHVCVCVCECMCVFKSTRTKLYSSYTLHATAEKQLKQLAS